MGGDRRHLEHQHFCERCCLTNITIPKTGAPRVYRDNFENFEKHAFARLLGVFTNGFLAKNQKHIQFFSLN